MNNCCNKKRDSEVEEDEKWAVIMRGVSPFSDQNNQKKESLEVHLKIEKGKFYLLTGEMGSGKTSLIRAILGETPLTKGKVDKDGLISYAGQDPWIFRSSVRENILFGNHFDRTRYSNVIDACALRFDIQQFPQGDQTIVGDRGCTLSGGQRCRINLARAVYREADIYLLDEPLSAVAHFLYFFLGWFHNTMFSLTFVFTFEIF